MLFLSCWLVQHHSFSPQRTRLSAVKNDSRLVGRSLDECGVRRDLGVIIVAMKRASGEMEFNPTSTSVIKEGDTLIAMGETKQLKALEDLVGV